MRPVTPGYVNSPCDSAWAGAVAYSGQILCDFSGYSSCAIGAALTLGFIFPDNFRYPYAAIGFADDYLKTVHRRNLGLTGRSKLTLQILASKVKSS